MILIQVNSNNDIFLSKALIEVLKKDFDFYVHFTSNELLEKFGQIDCYYGTDINYILLNGHNFDAFVSFMGLPHIGHIKNLFLVDFFKQINIPTVEIQHGLFQYGINNIDKNYKRGGFCEKIGEHIVLPMKYDQDYFFKWIGKDGIGYLKSKYLGEHYNKSSDYILITTNIHWNIYTEEERDTFVNMMICLIKSNPKVQFIWKNHPCEYNLFKQLSKLKLKNLNVFNKNESQTLPAEALMKNCKFGISTVSTTLADFEIYNKKVLIFDCKAVEGMINTIKCERFSTSEELNEKFNSMLNNENSKVGAIETGIEPIKESFILSKMKTITKKRKNKWNLHIAMDYIEKAKILLSNDANKKKKKFWKI